MIGNCCTTSSQRRLRCPIASITSASVTVIGEQPRPVSSHVLPGYTLPKKTYAKSEPPLAGHRRSFDSRSSTHRGHSSLGARHACPHPRHRNVGSAVEGLQAAASHAGFPAPSMDQRSIPASIPLRKNTKAPHKIAASCPPPVVRHDIHPDQPDGLMPSTLKSTLAHPQPQRETTRARASCGSASAARGAPCSKSHLTRHASSGVKSRSSSMLWSIGMYLIYGTASNVCLWPNSVVRENDPKRI
jgi:hypothetical protein